MSANRSASVSLSQMALKIAGFHIYGEIIMKMRHMFENYIHPVCDAV
jgi:hypothetical protein